MRLGAEARIRVQEGEVETSNPRILLHCQVFRSPGAALGTGGCFWASAPKVPQSNEMKALGEVWGFEASAKVYSE